MTTTIEPPEAAGARGWLARFARGRRTDPAWVRPALLALLAGTGLLYLVGLGASGWANAFYAAAVQAGATSWKAFFFGSFDASSFITVDKTPASLWVMALSARLFGVNPWSLLVPQALAGVATVGVLYATVRRWYGPVAGLLAGAVLATTPVATLMFRFNNPDALLVLLLVLGAYAVVRATERASAGWLALAGAAVGLGFLTKMLQAVLVVPAFALVYLVAAPTGWPRRLLHLLLAGLAMVASAGWWVAIVELWPAGSRPYIGGTQHNSVVELALGYNGFGRLTGDELGSVGGGRGWGQAGLTRLFGADVGGQVSWLLPAALILLVAGLATTARAVRTDRARAGYLLWGGWLLATGLTFSLMRGIFHAYYTVALAPAVGALVGMGATELFRRRDRLWAAGTLAAATLVTGVWADRLLDRSPSWYPWLRVAVLAAGVTAALGLLVAGVIAVVGRRAGGRPAWLAGRLRLAGPTAGLAVAVGLVGPLGYSLATAGTAGAGAIPSAGPPVAGVRLPGPPGRPPGGPPNGAFPGRGGRPGGGVPGSGRLPGPPPGAVPAARPGGPVAGGAGPGWLGGGGAGGLLSARTPGAEVVAKLRAGASGYTWVAAAVGANNAAGYQLASGEPVMAIGGFNGSDAVPTLEQFQRYVAAGRIHYFIGGTGPRGDSGSSYGEQIATWVAQTYPATVIAGTTLYDLTRPSGA